MAHHPSDRTSPRHLPDRETHMVVLVPLSVSRLIDHQGTTCRANVDLHTRQSTGHILVHNRSLHHTPAFSYARRNGSITTVNGLSSRVHPNDRPIAFFLLVSDPCCSVGNRFRPSSVTRWCVTFHSHL